MSNRGDEMNKCKQTAMLEDARDNTLDLYNINIQEKHPDENHKILLESLKNELIELEKAIKNPVHFANDILRHAMKDKSEGELYHGWMCNIKWAIYDSIKSQSPIYKDFDSWLQNGCESGANEFLNRLLK
jgi:hypothetical protein